MLRFIALAAMFVLVAATDAAQAQTGLVQYCTLERAFGQALGGGHIDGGGRRLSPYGDRRTFTPARRFPPFAFFQAGFSPTTTRLHSVEGEARYETRAEAREIFDAIAAELGADPRFAFFLREGPHREPSGFEGDKITLFTDAPDSGRDLRLTLRAALRVSSLSTVSLECSSAAVYRQAEAEAVREFLAD